MNTIRKFYYRRSIPRVKYKRDLFEKRISNLRV